MSKRKITDNCIACGTCVTVCEHNCITEGDIYVIDENLCIGCGECQDNCPAEAIVEA
jgi:ferredoxin